MYLTWQKIELLLTYKALTFFWTDTIPGRQCMSSCFFLLKQFEDVLIYLNSIKASINIVCIMKMVQCILIAIKVLHKNWLLKVHVCVVFMTMSICLQSYFYNDDSFNFNYAQAKAAVGNFKESEEVCNIRSEK